MRRKCLTTHQSQVLHVCSGLLTFSEKLAIHHSSPTCLYPSPLSPLSSLSFKQAPVAPIKTQLSWLHILLPLLPHLSTSSPSQDSQRLGYSGCLHCFISHSLSAHCKHSFPCKPPRTESPAASTLLHPIHTCQSKLASLCSIRHNLPFHLEHSFLLGSRTPHSPDFVLSSLTSPLAACSPLPDL